ncbi:MAG: pilus assembly PilX N-terminal domain-containing protein [Candidatus Zixiibacteriota bacterium]
MLLVILNSEKGSALIIALSLIAMLSGIAIMSLDRANTDLEMSYNQLHEEQAFYVAEAGMERAVAQLGVDPDWRTGYLSQPLGEGYYTVAVIDSVANPALADTIVLRATADVGGTCSNIECFLLPDDNKPYRRAAFGEKRLQLSGSNNIDSYNSDSGTYSATVAALFADIGSNELIVISSNADIGGNVTSATPGTISITGSPNIAGDTSSLGTMQPMNLVNDDDYTWAEDNNSRFTGMSGDYSFSPGPLDLFIDDANIATLQPGTYYFTSVYVDQDARIDIGSGGAVRIFIDGNIKVQNRGKINDAGKPTKVNVFSKGSSIDFDSDSEFRGTLYIPNSDFLHDSDARLYGAIIARRIEMTNNAVIHFDRALLDLAAGTSGSGYEIIAWRLQE